MSTIYDIKGDPKRTGPGMWITIHILAFHSTEINSQRIFCLTIRIICSNIPCITCRKHAIDYINSNPPEHYISENTKSMFKWSCEFHNDVNKRSNSAILDWTILYKKYEENSPKLNELDHFLYPEQLTSPLPSIQKYQIQTGVNDMNIVQKYNDDIFNRVISNIKKKK